jgi:hypothetical protein
LSLKIESLKIFAPLCRVFMSAVGFELMTSYRT